MALRPCLDCGVPTQNTRCPSCARPVEAGRTRRKRARRPYTSAERERRAAVVAAWRAQYGDWCPGWQRPAHPSADLTADHVTPVAAGGSEGGALTVLCRPCNAARGQSVS